MAAGGGSTGVSPLRRSAGALPIACDALNARTVAAREYHCPACASSPADRHVRFAAWALIARSCSDHGAPAVWLGTDRMYPYALCCPAVILRGFLCQGAITGADCLGRAWKGNSTPSAHLHQQYLKARYNAMDEFCFQPEPHIFINAQVFIPVFVFERSHGKVAN